MPSSATMAERSAAVTRGDRSLGYVPALDGVRGIAVAAVLVYHGGFTWARGGFLGVSTFFTLSGFLITTLLLADRDRQDRVDLGSFYRRRARRLLPAALLTLLLVLLYGWFVAGPTERVGMGGDVLATLFQVANWHFVLAGRSYADLFAAPSLLQHTWSLAIEEQFYLVFPPLIALAVARRWPLARITGAVAGALALAVALTAALAAAGASVDRLYFGTDTRAPELLAGVLLALALARRRDGYRPGRARPVAAAGAVGLALTVTAWLAVEQASSWLYPWGLLAYATVSTVLLAGCLVPGPVATALSFAPLRRLGEVSYGLYLFHWPVFRWLSAERLGTSRPVAWLIGTVVAVALAVLSHTLLEAPIRARGDRASRPADGARPRRRPPLPLLAGAAAVAVVVGALTVPTGETPIDIEATATEFDALAAEVPPRLGAPVVGVFGDSTATATSLGLARWASGTGSIAFGPGRTQLGCGLLVEGRIRYERSAGDADERCADRTSRYASAGQVLDLALVQFGPWDVADHELPGVEGWRTIGDPIYDAALREEALRLIDLLTAHGAVVLWVQPPLISLGSIDGVPPADPVPTSDPERMERFRAFGEELAEARPGQVRLIDLAGWMEGLPGGELDGDLRPDGVHFTEDTSLFVADEFLGPAILEAWDAVRDQPGS